MFELTRDILSVMKLKNTLQKGSVRYFVFEEGGVWYAAGLEFNIVEEGSTPQEALILLFEALHGYVESAKKIKARPNILNQKTDPEYEAMWTNRHTEKEKHKLFTFGELNLGRKLAAVA